MTPLILIITTFGDEAAAVAAIHKLLEEHLVACGTIIPKAKSIYSWQGKVEEAYEVVVLLKTTQSLKSVCMERLKELHVYEVPEIIVIESAAVSEEYLAWVQKITCNL